MASSKMLDRYGRASYEVRMTPEIHACVSRFGRQYGLSFPDALAWLACSSLRMFGDSRVPLPSQQLVMPFGSAVGRVRPELVGVGEVLDA